MSFPLTSLGLFTISTLRTKSTANTIKLTLSIPSKPYLAKMNPPNGGPIRSPTATIDRICSCQPASTTPEEKNQRTAPKALPKSSPLTASATMLNPAAYTTAALPPFNTRLATIMSKLRLV